MLAMATLVELLTEWRLDRYTARKAVLLDLSAQVIQMRQDLRKPLNFVGWGLALDRC